MMQTIYPYTDWNQQSFYLNGENISIQTIFENIENYFYYINILDEKKKESLRPGLYYHARRYLMSLYYLDKYKLHQGKIFEAGGSGFFTFLMKNIFQIDNIVHSKKNLQEDLQMPLAQFDTIISMEVMEHISDPEILHTFEFNGIVNMMKNFSNMLKIDGKIFLTTPNASGFYAIEKILNNRMPFSYAKHVREYSIQELQTIIRHFKFDIIHLSTENVFLNKNFTETYNLLEKYNFPTKNRGEDIILIAQKTANTLSIVNSENIAKDICTL